MMLSRPLVRVAATAAANPSPRWAAVSLFSTSSTASGRRPPILGDIHPENHEAFNAKQKTFREQMVAAQQEREASAWRAYSSPTNPEASGLGSLNSEDPESAKEFAEKEGERKEGPLSKLIYGTKEGREHEAQLQASFSQVIARGKYVHSIVLHQVEPDKVDDYVELVGKWYPRMASLPENKVHLVGSWRTEVGDCDTFGE